MSFKSTLNLPQTPMGKDEHKKLTMITQALIDHNDSVEFRQPVDWQGLGLTDYPTIIKHPMDLTTIKNKLTNNKYTYIEEAIDEIQLIWDNCFTFNAEGSWIYVLAEKLERQFRKLVKNYLPNLNIPAVPLNNQNKKSKIQQIEQSATEENTQEEDVFQEESQEDIGSTVSYNDKLKFSNKIKFLSLDQLAIIITLIQSNCPTAFKENDKQKAQIIVDNIEYATFKTINEQLDQWANALKEGTTKKVKR